MRCVADMIGRELLSRSARPGQYVGLETNARCPDVGASQVSVVLAFPDAYSIGISHLGTQVLYTMLNEMPGVACDRSYCPLPDAEAICRDRSVPLFGWESRCAVRDFDILGFSLAYEICVTNVLTMLDLAGIPLKSEERAEDDPIVIAGDAMADAPEPMADFIDLFVVGDGEGPLARLVQLVASMKRHGASRDEMILEAARRIPSIYAPRFYEPQSDDSGLGLRPLREDVPQVIQRAHIASFSDSPTVTHPLVPLAQAVHDRLTIEIMRGCPNTCRFCQAGATRLPVRHRSINEIVSIARAGLESSGWREISLLSLSTSDYPRLAELIARLSAEFAPQHVSISLPSMRASEQLRYLSAAAGSVRKGSLTIAPEAGSERLRKAIGKNISEQDMLVGIRAAYEASWRRIKLYFMAGLPGETDRDIDEIFNLCKRLGDVRKDVDGRGGAISASVSWFVPKPHTPMQWCPMREPDYFFEVRRRLIGLARRTAVSFKFHRIERSVLEAAICRGDRRMGRVIAAAWGNGARMDSWNEHFDYGKWLAAFEATGIDPAALAARRIPLSESLPWSHIRGCRSPDFLVAEHRRMVEALSG